jgi:hypothetical protein
MLLDSTFNFLGSCNLKWLRVAETAHPTTIARLIGRSVFGGGVNQFLARRNIHGTFKQTGLRYSSRQLLSLRYGGVDVTRRIRVPACQMILAVLDHALHADNT